MSKSGKEMRETGERGIISGQEYPRCEPGYWDIDEMNARRGSMGKP